MRLPDGNDGKRRPRWLVVAVAVAVVAATVGAIAAYVLSVIQGPDVIAAGNGPAALAISPDGRFLYASDYGGGSSAGETVTAVDLTNGKVGKPIRVGEYPTELAVARDGQALYVLVDPAFVSGTDSGEIVPVDPVTGIASRPLRFAGGADQIAISPDGQTLYVAAGDNSVSIVPIKVSNGGRRTSIALPDALGIPNALAVSADGKTVYAAYGSSSGGNDVNEIIPIDVSTGRQGVPIAIGNDPVGLAIEPGGHALYAIGNGNDAYSSYAGPHNLMMINLDVGKVVSTVSLGPTPIGLAVDPTGRAVFVQGDDNTIDVVGLSFKKVVASFRAAGYFGNRAPEGSIIGSSDLVVSPDGRTLYVSNGSGIAVMSLSGLAD